MQTSLWGENGVIRIVGIPELNLKSMEHSKRVRVDLPWPGTWVDEGEIWLTRIPGVIFLTFLFRARHPHSAWFLISCSGVD